MTARLTRSQEEALRIAAPRSRRGWPTYTSNINDDQLGCVAAGSASKLVTLGLAEWVGTRYSFNKILLTPAGLTRADEL